VDIPFIQQDVGQRRGTQKYRKKKPHYYYYYYYDAWISLVHNSLGWCERDGGGTRIPQENFFVGTLC